MRLDGRVIDRPSALVRAGAVLSFPRGDEIIVVRVEGIADRRGAYEEARHLYTDLRQLAAATGSDGGCDADTRELIAA